jgi:MFS family permease
MGGQLAERIAVDAAFYAVAACFALAAIVGLTLEAGPRPRPTLASTLQAVVESGLTPTPAPRRTTLPVAFLAGTILIMTTIAAASSMFPNYLSSLGRSYGAIGGLWSLAAALELPAMYITGLISDRTGRPPLLAAGAAAVAAVQILYIAAARIPSIVFLAQVVRAFGYASYTANSMTFTAEVSSEADRALNSGAYNVSLSAGQLLGAAAGGTLVQIVGFSVMFAICSVIASAAAVAFLLLGVVRPPAQPGRALRVSQKSRT